MAEKTSHAETRTRGEGNFFHKPSKKTIFGSAAVLLLAILIFGAVSTGLPERFFGARTVTFTQLKKDEIPQTIETDVIPEYRELERALGCLVNGKVYVVVTRGEKPTAGYDLAIEDIRLQKMEDGGSNMLVTARFEEPAAGESVSRIITYPYVVAETELTVLPDTSLAAGAGGTSAQSSLQAWAVSQPKVPTFAGKVQKDVLLSAKKTYAGDKILLEFSSHGKICFYPHFFRTILGF